MGWVKKRYLCQESEPVTETSDAALRLGLQSLIRPFRNGFRHTVNMSIHGMVDDQNLEDGICRRTSLDLNSLSQRVTMPNNTIGTTSTI